MSIELEEATACRTGGSLHSAVDVWQRRWTDQWRVHWAGWILDSLLKSNRTSFYYRFCQLRQPVNEAWIWLFQGPLDFSKHFLRRRVLVSVGKWKIKRLHTFITEIYQNCTCSCQWTVAPAWCEVKRSDTQHGLGLARTIVTKGTHFLYTVVYCWLDTSQQVGFDDLFSGFWNLLIRHWWH